MLVTMIQGVPCITIVFYHTHDLFRHSRDRNLAHSLSFVMCASPFTKDVHFWPKFWLACWKAKFEHKSYMHGKAGRYFDQTVRKIGSNSRFQPFFA